MQAFYSDRFVLPLPSGHRFPMAKYAALRHHVTRELPEIVLREPDPATEADLRRVHEPDYLQRVLLGGLSAAEQRAIGFPWSAAMVERSRRSVGATLAACEAALAEGIAVNLAGGTHHAHRDRGQGYCVFNDAAVAAEALRNGDRLARARRIAIVDLDVHQGDGTASIFHGSAQVFTLSLHGARNYPFRRCASHIDVDLADGTADDEYLAALDRALRQLRERFVPDFLIYLAGADAHEADRLGRLRLTFAGLQARDQRVFDLADQLAVPIAVMMAGGYGRDLDATVQVHFNTVQAAHAHWHRCRKRQHVEQTFG